MSRDIDLDLATAETAPFSASDGHRVLFALVGTWHGSTRTWLDPSAPPDVGQTSLRAEAILGGRFVRLEYLGTVIGKPHAGEMLLGYEPQANRFVAAWVDSFHMATGIMISTGEPRPDDTIAVLGRYAAGDQEWSWRTELSLAAGDLVLASFNITPDGQEHPAVESRLARR
jgi:Protein of unknown function (DUF1579)